MTKVHFNLLHISALFNLKTVGKTAGSKSWHVYKPSKVRMLDVSKSEDAALYVAAQELQKTVAKGTAKPKYENNSTTETSYNSYGNSCNEGPESESGPALVHYERFYKIFYRFKT